jgi:glycosyltransferase involved in cell wall biosynthesis
MVPLPKITLITPSLNQREFIEQTIESVLSQKYPDLEYIIMDGGSTDGTLEIVKGYEGKLRWISEPDRGQSHALNKGFRIATGEVTAYLNSDDRYEPGTLFQVGEYFARNPQTAWVTGRCRNIDPKGRVTRQAIARYKDFWLPFRSMAVLSVLNYISQPATFWRKRLFEEIGYFDEHLQFAMDYDFWLRIGKKYPLTYLSKTLACFRIHPASKSGGTDHSQFDEELAIAKRQVPSPWLIALHTFHRHFAVIAYHWMLGRESRKAFPALRIKSE